MVMGAENKQLCSGMSFNHLDSLRHFNGRVSFDALISRQPDEEYLDRLKFLNNACRSSFLKPHQLRNYEREFIESVEHFAARVKLAHPGKVGKMRLVCALENLFYLMERSEFYRPTEETMTRLLRLVPPDLRLEIRLPLAAS
jgi:hypothetical protein